LHDQNKGGFFGGPAFFQPMEPFKNFSSPFGWGEKDPPLQKSHFYFDHVNRLYMTCSKTWFREGMVNEI